MTYEQFEDLPVWQDAMLLAEGVDDLLREIPRDLLSFSKRDQIDRSSLSVSNNIAEGFERGTTPDLLKFIYIARGSSGETRSVLTFIERRPYLNQFKNKVTELKILTLSCSKQLRAWASHLQKTDIKGQRHLDNQT